MGCFTSPPNLDSQCNSLSYVRNPSNYGTVTHFYCILMFQIGNPCQLYPSDLRLNDRILLLVVLKLFEIMWWDIVMVGGKYEKLQAIAYFSGSFVCDVIQ